MMIIRLVIVSKGQKMKKIKLIKKLTSLTLIGGGVLTTLPLIISSCGCATSGLVGSIIGTATGDL
jgi:hypothetical protein